MIYADDTQLYFTCKSASIGKTAIENCIIEIREWMAANPLVLNDDKTEVVNFHSKFRTPSEFSTISVGSDDIVPSDSVRNLGFYFDSVISLSSHVSSVCKSASFALYRIGRIRRFLDRTSTERLIHALITSRLDYCNSILIHTPDYLIARLQRIHNSAARLICRTRKHEHITPILISLHWLPVAQRIHYKVLVISYKILNNEAPAYLSDLITRCQPKRTTRSEKEIRLTEPRYKQEFYGKRAFSVAAPRLWNSIPNSIREAPSLQSFQSMLKTYLFRQAYPSQ
jgi:hypothetical protein